MKITSPWHRQITRQLLFPVMLLLLASSCTLSSQTAYSNNQRYYTSNVWDDIADNLQLKRYGHYRSVRAQVNWYMKHRQYLVKASHNAQPYLYYIYQQVQQRGLPADLALLPIVESLYNPFAYSKVGAAGLWQIMPSTALGYGIKINWWYDGRRDIEASTNAALTYLNYLHRLFGDWLLAIAAYNSGEGRIQRAISANRRKGKSTSFWAISLPAETRTYVIELIAVEVILSQPDVYDVDFTAIKNEACFDKVKIGSPIDLNYAAKMAGISLEQLSQLNSGFSQWATDPSGPYSLLLPVSKISQFKKNLAKAPKSKLVTWQRRIVQKNDSLSSLSKRFHTSSDLLKEINSLKSNRLYPDHTLLIPLNSKEIHNIAIANERRYFASLRDIPTVDIIHHQVKKGDSLSSIARKYGVTVNQIRFWNNLKPSATLKAGMEINVWPPAKHRQQNFVNYTVKKGDSLYAIAKRYGTSASAIKRHNELSKDAIYPGQQLKIPAIKLATPLRKKIYAVKSGDNLNNIAKRYKVTINNIIKWNGLKNPNHLKIGQQLIIYMIEPWRA